MTVRAHRISALTAILAGLLLIGAGCGGPEGSPHSFRILQEAGVPTVVTSGGPRFEGDLFRYEPMARALQDDARPKSLLNDPSDVVLDAGGNIHVSDSGDRRVAVYDPQGTYIRSYGGPGSGPGEFRTFFGIHLFEGRVYLWDQLLRRTTGFTPDGSLVETIPARAVSGTLTDVVLPLSGSRTLQISLTSRGEGGLQYRERRAVVWSAAGDSLFELHSGEAPTSYMISLGGDANVRSGLIPYAGSPSIVPLAAGGFLVGTGTEPVLQEYGPDGHLVRRIRIDLPAEAVSDQERERTLQVIRDQMEQMPEGRMRDFGQARLEQMYFPDQKAYWTRVTVDADGYIWLTAPYSPYLAFDAEATEYLLLSPQGEYLGRTSRPGTFGIGHVAGGMLATLVTDEATGGRTGVVFRMVCAAEHFVYP